MKSSNAILSFSMIFLFCGSVIGFQTDLKELDDKIQFSTLLIIWSVFYCTSIIIAFLEDK